MVNASTGVKTVDRALIHAGQAMGAKGYTLFFQVLVPGAVPNLIAGYRITFRNVICMCDGCSISWPKFSIGA